MRIIQDVIKFIVLGVFYIIWTIVGGAVWIQLLVRVSAIFTGIMITALVGNSGLSRPDLSNYFDYSILFFFNGYISAYKSLFPTKNQIHKHYAPPPLNIPAFLKEITLTICTGPPKSRTGLQNKKV